MNNAPIAVLDSGLGGLTVVKALQRALPHEDILYFGDTARVPYGTKAGPTITAFVRQIIQYLRTYERSSAMWQSVQKDDRDVLVAFGL